VSAVTPRAEIIEPVRRVLDWLLSLRDAEGRIVCPEHKLEHTGKSAGAIVMACELARHAAGEDRDALIDVAVQQARRLVANLVREGNSTCHTFRPGRHDPYNCSNNVIDGGACSDALAELVLTFGDRLAPGEREAFANASILHAQTYLRYAVLDKGVPAQRAWAMTGVAGAWKLAGHEVLSLATTEGAGILEGIQHPDGSYPYHPLEWGAPHAGASDVSAFYQSRVSGFLLFSLERLDRDPADAMFRGPIERGLDFLVGLQAPDGTKCGLVEAKPWYWGATYEVASHPFDVYALCAGWRHYGRPRYAAGAERAFRAFVKHLGPDGEPRSHLPGPGRTKSYQCATFWAGHGTWLARSMVDLERILAEGERAPDPSGGGAGMELSVQHWPDASLTRLEDGAAIAWVRGARPGFNVHHGSPHGAGLLRVWSKARNADVLARCRLGGTNEAEWSGASGGFSPSRGWRSGGKEVRFALWIARTHWRAGRVRDALLTPPRVFTRGVLAFAAPRVGSAFHIAPETEVASDGVVLASQLARRDGTPIAGSRIMRTFRLDGDGLLVVDEVLDPGETRNLAYKVPARATDVEKVGLRVSYRLA
jgi:hypothetical protein